VADAEIVAHDRWPFDETWLDKFTFYRPPPGGRSSLNWQDITNDLHLQPCKVELFSGLLYIKSSWRGNTLACYVSHEARWT
jgi:hypothetical protein